MVQRPKEKLWHGYYDKNKIAFQCKCMTYSSQICIYFFIYRLSQIEKSYYGQCARACVCVFVCVSLTTLWRTMSSQINTLPLIPTTGCHPHTVGVLISEKSKFDFSLSRLSGCPPPIPFSFAPRNIPDRNGEEGEQIYTLDTYTPQGTVFWWASAANMAPTRQGNSQLSFKLSF